MRYHSRRCKRIRCIVMRCYVCHLSDPNFLPFFPTMCVDTHLRWFPAYVEETRSGFTRGGIEAWHPSKIKREHTWNKLFTSTVQLMPGDVDRMKVNPFQGKRKIDGWWDKADYEIACQVTNGSSSYEKQDSIGKLKVPHCKRFFLVATPHGASTA